MKTNLFNKIFLVFIIIFSTIFLSGCWNRRETNTMGIAGAVAFDIEDEKHKITIEIIRPRRAGTSEQDGRNEKPTEYVQTTGYSIFEAMRDATTKFDRKIFLPDVKVYIFSEKVARKGLAQFYDYLNRDHESRLGITMFITDGSTAADILGISPGISKVPSDYIKNMSTLSKSNAKSMDVYLKDFLVEYYTEGIEPIVGIVKKKPAPESQLQKTRNELSDEGAAVFLEDRLVGFLNGKETRAVNLVKGKVKSGAITSPSEEKGFDSIEIIKAKGKNSVKIENNTVLINVKIDLQTTMLAEITSEKEMDKEKIKEIEDATSKVVKKEVEDTIKKVQNEFKSDVFGFGKIVHKKSPDEWKKVKSNWNDMFSKARVNVDVSTTIRRHGLTDTPLKNKEAQ